MKRSTIRLGDLSVGFVQGLIGAVRESGFDCASLLSEYGLDAVSMASANARISIPKYMRLGHAAIGLTGDPALGLKMGQHCRLVHMGLAGVTAALATDIETAAKTLLRFEPLYAQNYRGQSHFEKTADGGWLHFYSIKPYNDYNRFVVDAILTAWLSQLNEIAPQSVAPDRVEIEYSEPTYAERFESFFQCPVIFSARHNRIHLPASCLFTSNSKHYAPTWHQLMTLCEKELEQLTRTYSLTERVAQLLGPQLNGPTPTLEKVAHQLKLPAWTLRRKLSEEHTSFRAILNKSRHDLAMIYIRDTDLAFGEVAYLLGFASAEAFQRAFKRWSGMTPGDFRRHKHLERRHPG